MTREMMTARAEQYCRERGSSFENLCSDLEQTKDSVVAHLLRFYDDKSRLRCITLPEIGITPEVFGVREERLLQHLPNVREGLLRAKDGSYQGMKTYIRAAFLSSGEQQGSAYCCIGEDLFIIRYRETENEGTFKADRVKMTPRALAKCRKKEQNGNEPAFLLNLLDGDEKTGEAIFQVIR